MSVYNITINYLHKNWVARTQTFVLRNNEMTLISDDNKQFPSKESAFGSLMARFKDLNFEDNEMKVNLIEIRSRFEFVKLLEKEFNRRK